MVYPYFSVLISKLWDFCFMRNESDTTFVSPFIYLFINMVCFCTNQFHVFLEKHSHMNDHMISHSLLNNGINLP